MAQSRRRAPRVRIDGRYLDEVRTEMLHSPPGSVAYRGFPAKHHQVVVDGDSVVLRTPAQTALQLFFDGVLRPDGERAVSIEVDSEVVGLCVVESWRAPDGYDAWSPVTIHLRRTDASPDRAEDRPASVVDARGGKRRLPIPEPYRGWWRIVSTSQWVDGGLDILGPALLSLTGEGDRLRMHCLLAHVKARPTKRGVSFTWKGAWEYDPMSGTGSARLDRDGRLLGTIRIRNGDDSSFVADRADAPEQPIEEPLKYRDKWRRRW